MHRNLRAFVDQPMHVGEVAQRSHGGQAGNPSIVPLQNSVTSSMRIFLAGHRKHKRL